MKEIASALVKAQKAFGPALKTSTNPHFKSRYADLSACVEAVIDGLNDNGIFLNQTSHECDDGVTVETVFIHESGETFSAGKLHVPAAKSDPQGYGSALTYARRYSLMAACGIAPEDDDGNAGTKAKQAANEDRQASAKQTAIDEFNKLTKADKDAICSAATDVTMKFNAGNKEGALAADEDVKAGGQEWYLAYWSQLDSPVRTFLKNNSQKKAA